MALVKDLNDTGGGTDPGRADGTPSRASRLRLARLARGLSQDQLAAMSGVTRQAVAGLEAGRWDPSLKVALRMAAALATSVESLFASPGAGAEIEAVLISGGSAPGAPHDGETGHAAPEGSETGRVLLARIGQRINAFPLLGDAATAGGFRPAHGYVVSGASHGDSRPSGEVAPTGPYRTVAVRASGSGSLADPARGTPAARVVAIAGCDPAIPLLAGPLGTLDPPVELLWWSCSSIRALELLAAGAVHAAGMHVRSEPSHSYNTPLARTLFASEGAEVIGFASWREGLVMRTDLAGAVETVADIARLEVPIANREPGSEARAVLERECARHGVDPSTLSGYRSTVQGHLEVASALRAGLAGAGVASEPAARVYGLSFVPITTERYDMVIRARQVHLPEVQALIHALGDPALSEQLDALPGYDASACGTVFDIF